MKKYLFAGLAIVFMYGIGFPFYLDIEKWVSVPTCVISMILCSLFLFKSADMFIMFESQKEKESKIIRELRKENEKLKAKVDELVKML